MFTVTFYSFKGGVGRTQALMNTAFRLSRKGRSVFILDFDLEAPGFEAFLRTSETEHVGLLEYLNEFMREGEVPDIRKFVQKMQWGANTHVTCMTAGKKDSEYQRLLAQLNWKDFYANERGYLFVENMKAAIQSIYNPDYLLIDSRTGMTDVSGICTLQLPDLVVFLFALNDQNLNGTAQILRTVTQNQVNRAIQSLLVASPVPDVPEHLSIKKQRLERAVQLLGSEPALTLPYDAFVALRETINPAELSKHLSRSYDELSKSIQEKNGDDFATMLKTVRKARDLGDLELAESRFDEILKVHSENPHAWHEYGRYLRSLGKSNDALEAFERSNNLLPSPKALWELVVTNITLKNISKAKEELHRYLPTLHSSEDAGDAISLAELFVRKDEVESAIEVLLHLLAQGWLTAENRWVAELELANLYLRLDRPNKAAEVLRRPVQSLPAVLALTYNLAVALERSGLGNEAMPLFERSIVLFEQMPQPKSPKEQANYSQAMSQAYSRLGNIDKALSSASKALAVSESAGPLIFSSFQYREIPVSEFKAETERLIATLGKQPAEKDPS